MKTSTGSVLVRAALLALPGALALLLSTPHPALADSSLSMKEYFRVMDEKYAPFTTLSPQQTRGTGFKPYERFRSFFQHRLGGADNLPPGVRWEAWQKMAEIEKSQGTRSETWFSLGPVNVAGRCLAIEVDPIDPNTVYAGFASSGIWKTTNGGTTWTALADDLPTLAVSAIEIDSSNPNRIWIGTGEGWGNIDAVHGVGVLVSTDAGVSWSLTGYDYSSSSGRDVYELEYNPATGTLMVTADNGLWRSVDQGATFTRLYGTGQWTDVELQRGSSSVMFATCFGWTGFGFYRSQDDGATWTRLTNGTPASNVANNRFALTDDDAAYIYWAVAASDGSTLGIWRSADAGDSFTQVFFGNHYGSQGWYDLTVDVDPANKNTVFSGGVSFYRSVNGGASFSEIGANVHVDHHATAWAPSSPTRFWVGSDGGVWSSINSGASYTDRNAGLTTLQFYAVNNADSMPTRALGGTQDNGTYLYNNSLSWSSILGGDGFFTEVDRQNPNWVYGELYFGSHYRSGQGGPNMVRIDNGISEQGPWSTPTHMDYANPATLYTAHNTKVFKTTNRGDLWTWMGNPNLNGGGVSISQCRTHPENLAVISTVAVWLTTDSGATWIDRTSGQISLQAFSDIAVHPSDPNTVVLTLATYNANVSTVRKTTDQGLTWFDIDGGLPDEPVNTIEIDPQHPNWYFIGTDLGVYLSFTGGATWQPFNTGLPHVVVSDLRLQNSARLLRAGTHGRGMWEVDISDLFPTAVGEVMPTVQPLTLRIMGNPAADRTLLRYGIRSPGQVHLGLYDVGGRLVRRLVDRFEYPILGSVELDLRSLSAGVYFARLESNGAELSRKIVVER
jgi:hypothetical protein